MSQVEPIVAIPRQGDPHGSTPDAPAYPYPDEERPDVLRMIPPDGKVVGSIGCGSAALEAHLVRQGREVHGVDVCAAAIDGARRRLTTARVISPDERNPFPPDSLDGLILADVLEHIPLAWQALASFARAVRPGGWVVISVPNMRSIEVLVRFVLQGDWPEHPVGIFDRTHIQVMTRRRLARWCASAGLRAERWFDRYPVRRTNLFVSCDWLTAKLFHSWFMFQVQVLCRKDAVPT